MTTAKLVFLADDDQLWLRSMEIRLKAMGLQVETATDGVTALVRIVMAKPDLVVIDVGMPSADGIRVCERLRERQFQAPIIIHTGHSDEAMLRQCEQLGARHMLKGSVTWKEMQLVIAGLLDAEARPPQPENPPGPRQVHESAPKVLTVDDDPRVTQAIAIRLRHLGIEVLTAANGVQGYMIALRERPDVIITDYHMPDGPGDYFIHRLRGAEATRNTPVIVLTGGRTMGGERDHWLERDMRGRVGVAGYLIKPVDFDVLLGELRRHITVPEPVEPG